MPATAENPTVGSLASDESDAAAVIAKSRRRTQGWQSIRRVCGLRCGFRPRQRRIWYRGARGKGYVYRHGHLIGLSTLTQLTIGFQAGGQATAR